MKCKPSSQGRVRNEADRRKMNIHLAAKGRRLQAKLGAEVVDTAVAGFSGREIDLLPKLLRQGQENIARRTRGESLLSPDGAAEGYQAAGR